MPGDKRAPSTGCQLPSSRRPSRVCRRAVETTWLAGRAGTSATPFDTYSAPGGSLRNCVHSLRSVENRALLSFRQHSANTRGPTVCQTLGLWREIKQHKFLPGGPSAVILDTYILQVFRR